MVGKSDGRAVRAYVISTTDWKYLVDYYQQHNGLVRDDNQRPVLARTYSLLKSDEAKYIKGVR